MSGVASRWTFWKFNWLANHKVVAVLERTRRHARGELLDIGCGSMPFKALYTGHVARYWGTDLVSSPNLGADRPCAWAIGDRQPFRDATFDTVLGLSMLNYVPEPADVIAEAARVLKPGGVALLEFAQMVPAEYLPGDYFRFTRYAAERLLVRAGFEVLEVHAIGGLWARVGLTVIGGLNKLNRGPLRILTEIPVRLLYILVQLLCEGLDRVFFDPNEVLGHLVVARRKP